MSSLWVLINKKNNISECWKWKGHLAKSGYGVFKEKGKREYAHRAIYKNFFKMNINKFLICHHCDNPKCCNPFHLYHGNYKTNAVDREKRNRRKIISGENCNFSKLSYIDVKTIKNMLKLSLATQRDIAELYNVHYSTISAIKCGKSWRRV